MKSVLTREALVGKDAFVIPEDVLCCLDAKAKGQTICRLLNELFVTIPSKISN